MPRGRIYAAIRRALRTSLARGDFRVLSIAVRTRALELVVEADDRVALARGMQGFQVSAAKHVNRSLDRRGAVFPDRYRARALVTTTAVRALLAASSAWRRAYHPVTAIAATAIASYSSRSTMFGSLAGSDGASSASTRYSSPSQRPRSTR
jgi:hypothetical protein